MLSEWLITCRHLSCTAGTVVPEQGVFPDSLLPCLAMPLSHWTGEGLLSFLPHILPCPKHPVSAQHLQSVECSAIASPRDQVDQKLVHHAYPAIHVSHCIAPC